MKSVVALLVLVALCNANIVKDGGLKGSWADTIEFVSTLDTAAPIIGYYSTGSAMDDTTIDVTDETTTGVGPTYYSTGFDFGVSNEDRLYEGGMVEVTFTMTSGTTTYSLPTTCYISTDTYISCTIYYGARPVAGVYTPTITVTDEVGNWATATAATFTDVDRPVTLTITNTGAADTTKPVITAVTAPVATVALPTDAADYSAYAYYDITAMVHDNSDPDATGYDVNASGVALVWVVLSDDDGATEWNQALMYDSRDTTTQIQTWGVRLAFANWAETGTWTVLRVEASDFANNVADDFILSNDITITWSHDSVEDVMSCQTIVASASQQLNVDTNDYGYQGFTLGCTEKYSGENFVYLSFQSAEYLAAGDDRKSMLTLPGQYSWGNTDYPLGGLSQANLVSALGDTVSGVVAPGELMAASTATVYIQAYTGYPGVTQGDYTLYEVITFTESGLVQYYTSDQGAASAVVPSVLAVLVAAIVAMLRL